MASSNTLAKLIPSLVEQDENGNNTIRITQQPVTRELVQGVDYDRIDITYPTTKNEVFTYSKNGVIVLTVTSNYQTDAKENLISVVYS